MADEAASVAEVEELRPEDAENQEQPQKPRTVEDLAIELGWKPKDQWQGDESLWQPADAFLRAPRESRDNGKREIQGLRRQIERLTHTSSQILGDRLAEKDRELAALQARAVEDGDNAAVDRVVSERIKLKEQALPSVGPPAETLEFQERNKAWFGVDPTATARAKRIAQELAEDGYDIPTQLAEVEKTLRRERPDLFPKPKEAPGTQTATSRAANSGSRAKGFADMPPESQKMALEYEQRHGIKKDDFAKSYWAEQAKQRRA